MSYERSTRVTWSNWTFGVWWGRKKLHAFGIDFGPVEIVWKEPLVTPTVTESRGKVLRFPETPPEPLRMRNRKIVTPITDGPFKYDSGPVRPDLRGRRDELKDMRDRASRERAQKRVWGDGE